MISSFHDKRYPWVLGAAAVLLERNGLKYENGYDRPTEQEEPDWKQETTQWMESSWSVTDHDSALYQITSLIDDGKRMKFNRIRSFLSSLPVRQQRSVIESIGDPEASAEYRIVYTYHSRLPLAGIAGYDWGRSIFLAHYAKLVGFISPEEFWELALKLSVMIQQSYGSWDEYGTAFNIGRQFFYREWSEESAQMYFMYTRKLLLDKNSPWRTIPWDTPLD